LSLRKITIYAKYFYVVLEGCKRVSCKWIFKGKHDSHGKLESYKEKKIAKHFIHINWCCHLLSS